MARGLFVAAAESLYTLAVFCLFFDMFDEAVAFLAQSAQVLTAGMQPKNSRFRVYLTGMELCDPEYSAWRALKGSENDRAYIKYLGFDRRTFSDLAQRVMAIWPLRDPRVPRPQGGRPPSIWADDSTALVLAWLTSTADDSHFQMEFGLPPSTFSRHLNDGLDKLVEVVQNHPDAVVNLPTVEECAQFAALLKAHRPGYDPAVHQGLFPIGFMDGTTFSIPAHPNRDTQRAYYSGFKAKHCINNIFLFCPDGTIRSCKINLPGSWHDAHAAGEIYDLLEEQIAPHGFCVLADSAFFSARTATYMACPLRKNQVLPSDADHRRLVLKRSAWIVDLRQAAEWGMRAVKATFPRLLNSLSLDPFERRRMLSLCIGLFNIRARAVGMSQIQSVFMPELMRRVEAMDVDGEVLECEAN